MFVGRALTRKPAWGDGEPLTVSGSGGGGDSLKRSAGNGAPASPPNDDTSDRRLQEASPPRSAAALLVFGVPALLQLFLTRVAGKHGVSRYAGAFNAPYVICSMLARETAE